MLSQRLKKYLTINTIAQFGLVTFTILGFLLISLKLPQYGLLANLVAQIFWLYSSYKAWKNAGQVGMFINTLIVTGIVVWGVFNYWII